MKQSSRTRTRKWLHNHLLDSDFVDRVETIETLTTTVSWAPKTWFYSEKDYLVQSQELIFQSSDRPKRKHIVTLGEHLDAQLNIVHGDLCRKNMVFDGQHLRVIDWEPSLYQIRKGIKQFLVTEPYWAISDRSCQCVSPKTDKLAFFFTAFKIVHQRDPLVYLREWISVRQLRPVPMTPIPEEELTTLSFTEIITLVDNSERWTPRLIFGEER